jgi:hypothetical protein
LGGEVGSYEGMDGATVIALEKHLKLFFVLFGENTLKVSKYMPFAVILRFSNNAKPFVGSNKTSVSVTFKTPDAPW